MSFKYWKRTGDHPGRRFSLTFMLLLITWSGFSAAESRSQDASLKEVLRKAQGVMRQLNADKAALEAEKTALLADKLALENRVKQLEATASKLENLQPALERCQAGIESLQTVKTGLESQLEKARDKDQHQQRQQQALTEQSRLIQADNQWLVEAVKEREQWITRCGTDNQALIDNQTALIGQYREKGLWKRLSELEPLTGIGSVVTENTAESYRYTLNRLKTTPFASSNTPRPAVDAPNSQHQEGGQP